MKCVSIDIGWRNLSYCVLNVTESDYNIEQWEIFDLMPIENEININTTCLEDLIKLCAPKITDFIELFLNQNIEIAYLELQPLGPMARNIKTKTLSHILQTLFIAKNINVEFISPNKKLKGMERGNSYVANKKFAIQKVQELLSENIWLEKFNEHRKKDDLADAFLQGLYSAKETFIIKKVKKPRQKKAKRNAHEITLNNVADEILI